MTTERAAHIRAAPAVVMTRLPMLLPFLSQLSLPLLAACASAPAGPTAPQGGVTSPEEHLGRPVGADFHLVSWGEHASYLRKLAEESPRVITEKVGTTTEGRDFLLTVVSSEANLARLDEIKAASATLADPRGKSDAELAAAVEDGRAVLFVSTAMHATECAGGQFGMDFAWRLATSDEEPWRSAREECVVLLACLNPDGMDEVTSWYRETVGTPYEASGLLRLYQLYAGHDNNRDWFALTQSETRIVTELLYDVWRPQVYWDVHQQGSTRERFFVPPFRDPLDPNLDGAVIAAIDALGSRALLDLTREGLTGVSTGVSYDMWWNGGNRNVPVRHNIVGLLTEAASARLATPMFLPVDELSQPRGIDGEYGPSNRFPEPWPGGWWRLRDVIDYELAFGRSLLGSLTRERRFWLQNALDTAQRALAEGAESAPRAWIVPSDARDVGAARRLCDILLASGVELFVAEEGVACDGRAWPAGSVVIPRHQPYGTHVKDLFEVQRYPDGAPPYDVSGWTLPQLFGVHRVEAMSEPVGELRRVGTADAAVAGFGGDGRAEGEALSARESVDWTRLFRALGEGSERTFVAGGERAGLFVPGRETVTRGDGLTVPAGPVVARLPRVGLYSPWSGSMDEGWARWVLDTFELPYVSVRNEMLRAGRLGDILDVLVVPSISGRQLDRGRAPGTVPDEFARGLDPEGAVAVEEFVRAGGTLVALGSSSSWAVDLFELPLVDVTRGEDGEGFSCPGSVLRGIPVAHALTADLPASIALFFSRSQAWREMTEDERKEAQREDAPEVETLLRYAPSRVLLSGWIEHPEAIEGRAAWLRAPHGAGEVHLFGFRPQYRGWAQATFHLLFRAIVLAGAEGA